MYSSALFHKKAFLLSVVSYMKKQQTYKHNVTHNTKGKIKPDTYYNLKVYLFIGINKPREVIIINIEMTHMTNIYYECMFAT